MENSIRLPLLICRASFLGVDAWFCYPGVFQRCWLSLSLPLTGRRGCLTSLLPFIVQQGQTDQIVGLAISAIHKVDTGYGGFFLWYILVLKGYHCLWRGKLFPYLFQHKLGWTPDFHLLGTGLIPAGIRSTELDEVTPASLFLHRREGRTSQHHLLGEADYP